MAIVYPDYPDAYLIPTFMAHALKSVVDEYASRGVELPSRQYWMTGEPAYDCDQVVVHTSSMRLGLPGDAGDAVTCDTGRVLDMSISIVRCTPVASTRGTPIPEDTLVQEAAAKIAVDMELLLEVTKRLDPARNGLIASVNAAGPEGGTAAAVGSYTLAPYVYLD